MPSRTHNIRNLDMEVGRDEFRSFCAVGLARNKSLNGHINDNVSPAAPLRSLGRRLVHAMLDGVFERRNNRLDVRR
jgi:hypothetical protein